MTRPIAARLRAVCALIEAIGPCGSGAVALAMTAKGLPMTPSAAGQYCFRAVAHGLIEADRSQSPQQFTVAEDWRELIDLPRTPAPKPQPALRRYEPHPLHSIWGVRA